MEQKPFLGIETVSKDLLEAVVEQNGRQPDNFVDSAEGAYAGTPNIRHDPSSQELVKRIDAVADRLIEEAKGGEPGAPSGETAPGK